MNIPTIKLSNGTQMPQVGYDVHQVTPDECERCVMDAIEVGYEVAQEELNQNARPAYKGNIDLSQYDTIYLGYPIWWGTMPMCVFKFIEDHDGFASKTVLPYSTHEGSGLGSSISDLKELCPKATIKKGVGIKGSTVKTADVSKNHQPINMVCLTTK